MGNLFHIWGEAGTGKTLLACALVAEVVREGHVRWVCADGKQSFAKSLRANVGALEVHNITVNIPRGNQDVRNVILTLTESIHSDTSMVVIDPITRVLDMARRDDIMWGVELLEEALPSLVALSEMGIKVVLVSEVRNLEDKIVPVMHGSIAVWRPVDLQIVRGPGRSSIILDGGESPLAKMTIGSDGVVTLTTPLEERRRNECSERSSATL
jgi:hypothetical protein